MAKIKPKYRLWQWSVVTALGIAALWLIAPHQLSIILLKGVYVVFAVTLGYYADRALFPYARPHELAKQAWVETTTHTFKTERCEAAWRAYSLAMLRRAVVVAAVVIAFALGL